MLEVVQLPLHCRPFHLEEGSCCSLVKGCCILTMCLKWSSCHFISCLSFTNSLASSGSIFVPSILAMVMPVYLAGQADGLHYVLAAEMAITFADDTTCWLPQPMHIIWV